MSNNWFKKALNKLFDVNEEKELDDPTEEKKAQAPKEHQKPDRRNSIGRIESGDRKNEARIVHQYPRDGNFRFPLIPDESYKSGRKVDSKNSQKSSHAPKPAESKQRTSKNTNDSSKKQAISKPNVSKNTTEPQDEPPKKFGGVNFKPTDIPSPIYGFSKRPVAEKVEKAIQETENSNKYTPLNEHKVIDQLIHNPTDYSSEETEINYHYSSELNEKHDEISQDSSVSESDSLEFEESEETSEPTIDDDSSSITATDDFIGEQKETIISDNHPEENSQQVNLEGDREEEQEIASPIGVDEEAHFEEQPIQQEEELTQQEQSSDYDGEEKSDDRAFQIIEDIDLPIEQEAETEEKPEEEQEEEPTGELEEHVDVPSFIEREETSEPLQSEEPSSEEDLPETKNTQEQAVEHKEQEKIERPVKKENKKVEQKREEGRPKPQVPYNVMMLASDRRHLVKKPVSNGEYKLPPISLLDIPPRDEGNDEQWLEEQRELLESTLKNFNVQATVIGATMGPTVTRFEVQPSPGVKVNKITNLSDDIKLSLAARDIRMEAPIPGRNAIGIEVPNPSSRPVFIREIVRNGVFQSKDAVLNAALGFDIGGNAKVTDIHKMPHGLIAGATGSGKSVCINSILVSLLLNSNPADVKMLLIDPKMVELAPYNGLPHLVTPVINDVKEATTALKWAVDEMEERYEKFAAAGVRDIKRYNDRAIEHGEPQHKLPYIVVVIDELADLMMVSPQDVEDAICRIAQKARACGIHLLVATQRPSVDVITGLIKANIPTRIAFSVSSQIDSRTILDTSGAEKLLGKGDMLCLENGSSKPVRLQGNFVSDEEIERVTSFVRKQRKPNYLIAKEDLAKKQQYNEQEDDLFEEACMWALDQGQASSSALQRRFRIGFNRAARLIEMMEERGLVSEAMGSKPRSILMSKTDFEETFLKDMRV
ncbi:DNA translocase FtsK [Guptibacillus algicola]|uniref:DNA translocase FtsK n=1 Tax=Guptibacillus algicola TaxID=225844 RepID=UPI001CD7DFE7|nr:DNA translocase FtsK [Alkalihalobacillus algicola]MCA0986391.1 DNA translocase FtsK [Alkalihalobacillus algicola]